MAIRSIAQLKAWFQKGKYPTAEQFSDWLDSYFHKDEDTIPISKIDELAERLNNKYPVSDGAELRRDHDQLQQDFNAHKTAADKEFDNIHTNLEELEAEDEKIWADVTAHKLSNETEFAGVHQDITALQAVDAEIKADIATHKQSNVNEFAGVHQDITALQAVDAEIKADIATHKQSNVNEFAGVHQDITTLQAVDAEIKADIAGLEATDTALQTSLTAAHNDIGKIREMLGGGATLDEAKAALVALGSNYKDLYAVASTLKTFLTSKDTADATINTWQEIESFLQGITDTQSLTTLLSNLEVKITSAYNTSISSAVEAEKQRAQTAEATKVNLTDPRLTNSRPAAGGYAAELMNQKNTAQHYKIWCGSQAEYDAIAAKDSFTIYYIV